MEDNLIKKSRYLSMLLRHKPEKANLVLDKAGWTDVKVLLANTKLEMSILEEVVDTNNKKRFEFNHDKSKIRARQGHSVNVNLGYSPQVPPDRLYHGTAYKFLDSIMDKGLIPMGRHQVHMCTDYSTACTVGKRHGKLVVLEVLAKEMIINLGAKFYKTDNEVWLTDYVPVQYLEILERL